MGDRKYYGALVDQQWHPDYVYFPYADLKEIIKGVNCPKCEKQWLGHHFNGARWCADCGHSFNGKQFCCIETGRVADGRGRVRRMRYRYRPTADLPRTDGWLERFAERIQRDASRPAEEQRILSARGRARLNQFLKEEASEVNND